jgi:hypothetical protein
VTATIPHLKTRQEIVSRLDQATDEIFANGIGSSVAIADPHKEWTDSTMAFSLTAKVGFISVPLAGTVAVDDSNVTVECDLPPMVKNFVGEAKAQAAVEKEIGKLIA